MYYDIAKGREHAIIKEGGFYAIIYKGMQRLTIEDVLRKNRVKGNVFFMQNGRTCDGGSHQMI